MQLEEIVQKYKYNPVQKLKEVGLYDDFMDTTAFLCEHYGEVTIGQRIWHISNDVSHIVTNMGYPARWEQSIRKYHTTKLSLKELVSLNNNYQLLRKFNLLEECKNVTAFLDDKYEVVEWAQRFWHIKTEKYKTEKCVCGNNKKWIKKKSKYSSCSRKCNEIEIKKSVQKKYGVDNYSKTEEFKNKTRNTNITNFGVSHPMKLDEYKEHHKKLREQKFVKTLPDGYELIEYGDVYKIKHVKCGKSFDISRSLLSIRRTRYKSEMCTHCNPPFSNDISNKELELQKFVSFVYTKEEIQTSVRGIIPPYELDIYLPELKLAFEFNGNYWHSEANKDKNYHKMKSDLCMEQGIKLIHIWEHDWEFKPNIIKSVISGYLGKYDRIYARKCKIIELKAKDCRKFMNDNHLQGFVGATIYYGLIYSDELVSVMSFQKHKDHWEISRLCSKLNTTIIGGTERLWKYFLKNNEADKVITYSNRDYFTGKIYKRLGFKLDKITEPGYWYSNSGLNVISRQKCQKHILVGQGYDPNKTAHNIMLERGYYRCHNSGNYKFKIQTHQLF